MAKKEGGKKVKVERGGGVMLEGGKEEVPRLGRLLWRGVAMVGPGGYQGTRTGDQGVYTSSSQKTKTGDGIAMRVA